MTTRKSPPIQAVTDLGHQASQAHDDMDRFARELDDANFQLLTTAMTSTPSPALSPPSAGLRRRILSAALHQGRFYRFAAATSAMLDIDLDAAKAILDDVDVSDEWTSNEVFESLLIRHPGSNEVLDAKFVRFPAGITYAHEHHRGENALVMQGSYYDEFCSRLLTPGDQALSPAGIVHRFHTTADGPALLCLVTWDS